MSKVDDFVSLIIKAARATGLKLGVEAYRHGAGAMITSLEMHGNVDLDHFLIEITTLADEDKMGLQLSLGGGNTPVRNEFQKHGFFVVGDAPLQMERNPQGIAFEELEFMESAPPGKKAEQFIKHHKADFRKRYGKRWKQVLYATAWKQFGESRTFKDYLGVVESLDEGC